MVEIVEVGPRDGLQNEAVHLTTDEKIEFVLRAYRAGVQRVEVTSFVSPRAVPALADAEAVVRGVRAAAGRDLRLVGLVVNARGVERAIAAGVDEVNMVVLASETFSRRNQGTGIDGSVARWQEIVNEARAAGLRAGVTLSAAFGCPFEGPVPPARVIELAERVAASEPAEIAFADTIGVAVPTQITDLVSALRERLPSSVLLRAHFHNTRNTGIANAYAAVEAGVGALDASIGGIGGCPFAPAATGNIATEDLVYLLEGIGRSPGVDLVELIETAAWLEERGLGVSGMLGRAGPFPAVPASPVSGEVPSPQPSGP